MLRVIIASPYAGAIEANVAYAKMAVRHSLDLGEAPFASHLLYTQVLQDGLAQERERGNKPPMSGWQPRTEFAFYIDHGWSRGMIKELKIARLLVKATETRHILRLGDGLVWGQSPLGEELTRAGIVEAGRSPIEGAEAYVFRAKPEESNT